MAGTLFEENDMTHFWKTWILGARWMLKVAGAR